MKLLKIKRHHGVYTPGDITGFPDEHAQRLIDAGIAEAHDAAAQEVEAKSAKPPAKADSTKSAGAKG
jgi:hypothetical protein